jgi:uncharacterized protein with von Willebrand factor type A (vWA) domain
LDPYVSRVEAARSSGGGKVKPLSLLVLTDGAPDRDQGPEPVIVEVAKRLDAAKAPLYQVSGERGFRGALTDISDNISLPQVGIQFIQVSASLS